MVPMMNDAKEGADTLEKARQRAGWIAYAAGVAFGGKGKIRRIVASGNILKAVPRCGDVFDLGPLQRKVIADLINAAIEVNDVAEVDAARRAAALQGNGG